jgi:DNA adenine methylase
MRSSGPKHSGQGTDIAMDAMDVVNVASVPKRSPFRYPGGKTWLIPHIRRWLGTRKPRIAELIEPFAGGAIVGLTAAFEQLADSVRLIEKDEDVSAVWQTIFSERQGRWLADHIVEFELTPENVRAELNAPTWKPSLRERAFRTILRNRVQRGGILAAGAGLMKVGENGRGLASRWYPQTLRKRILDLLAIRNRIAFEEGDGMQAIRNNADRRNVAFFIDPPYTVAGRRLYTYSEIDHEELFRMMSRVAGDFLMTYDNVDEIARLAQRYEFETRLVAMKNTHHAKMAELLIGRQVDWLPQPDTFRQASLEFDFQTLPD